MAFTLLPATGESLAEIPTSTPLPFPDDTENLAALRPGEGLSVPDAADPSPAPSLKDGIVLPDGVPEITDLTAGIPQVEVEHQPAAAFALGENEWDVADRKTAEQKWRRLNEGRDLVERAKLDEEGFYKGDNLGFAGDPAHARLLATNDLFLQVETDGAPVPPWGLERDFYIGQVGARLFPGKDVSTPEALSQRISEFTQGRKNKKELLRSLGDEATKAETFGSIGERAPTFQAWREKAKTMPGYERGNDADYYEAWARNQKAAKEYMAPFRNELGEVWKAMKQGGAGSPSEILKSIGADIFFSGGADGESTFHELDKKDAGAVAFEIYDKLDTAQRAGFMNSLHLLVKSFPKEEQADVLANLGKTGGRMVDDIGRGIMGRFTLKAFEEHMNDEASKTMGPWGLSEADRKLAADNAARIRADRLLQRNFTDAIRSMERDE